MTTTRHTDTELLSALREAQQLYKTSAMLNRQQRFDAVTSIAEWDLFTLQQISQLSGLSTSTLYGMNLKRGHTSGKFNPMSIDTLIQLLLNRINGSGVSLPLLKAAVNEGNSHRIIYKFTGIQPAKISRMLNGNHSSSLQ